MSRRSSKKLVEVINLVDSPSDNGSDLNDNKNKEYMITEVIDLLNDQSKTPIPRSSTFDSSILQPLDLVGTVVSTPYGYGQIAFPDPIQSMSHSNNSSNFTRKRKRRQNIEMIEFEIPMVKVQLTYGFAFLQSSIVNRLISSRFTDKLRCEPRMMMNDNVINFALERIRESLRGNESNSRSSGSGGGNVSGDSRISILNTYAYDLLRRYIYCKNMNDATKRKKIKKLLDTSDLQSMEYIILPVSAQTHWSLLILCNCNQIKDRIKRIQSLKLEILSKVDHLELKNCTNIIRKHKIRKYLEEANFEDLVVEKIDKDISIPCIIHLDSANLHHSQLFFTMIRKFLHLLYFNNIIPHDYEKKSWTENRKTSKSENEQEEDLTIQVCDSSRSVQIEMDINIDALSVPGFSAKISKQNNSYDCGPYMIQFCKEFIQSLPHHISRQFIQTKGQEYFTQSEWLSIPNKIDCCRSWIKSQFDLISSENH